MTAYSWELVYVGFLLPSLFSVTLVVEGIYKIYRHEEGLITFLMGLFFLAGLAAFYLFLLPR